MYSKDYSFWLKIYSKSYYNIYFYIYGLLFIDLYFLLNANNKLETLNEMEYDFNGFLEKDIKYLINGNKFNKEMIQLKLILAVKKGINLSKYKLYFKEDFNKVIEDLLVTFNMEKYGISFEKAVKLFYIGKIISIDDLMIYSIKHGEYINNNNVINKKTMLGRCIGLIM